MSQKKWSPLYKGLFFLRKTILPAFAWTVLRVSELRIQKGSAAIYQTTRMTPEKEDRTMKHLSPVLRTFGVVTFLGIASLALLPLPAHAGGVHVSFGFGLPVPVVVAPQPVYVPPVPVVVAGPDVVYTHSYSGPRYGYGRPRHYGYGRPRHHGYWRSQHYGYWRSQHYGYGRHHYHPWRHHRRW